MNHNNELKDLTETDNIQEQLVFKICKNIHLLINACDIYKVKINKMLASWETIMNCHDLIFNLGEENPVEIVNFTETFGVQNSEEFNFKRFNEQLNILKRKIGREFNFFKNNIQGPLIILERITLNVASLMKCKSNTRNEIITLSEELETYTFRIRKTGNNINARQEIKRIKLEQQYHELFEKLKELDWYINRSFNDFLTLFEGFMKTWFLIYFFSTYRIWYLILKLMLTSVEVRKMIN